MSRLNPIVFCADAAILPGLHAALFSLIQNLGQRENASLYIFFQDMGEDDLEDLRRTATAAGGVGELQFLKADYSNYRTLRPLTGSRMAYLRLDLPQLLPDAQKILYLDCDLIVSMDVTPIFDHDLGEVPLGVTSIATMNWALEHAFFRSLGMSDHDKIFNSGVLLFNALAWRKEGLTKLALEFGRIHSPQLLSADQTILNALFYERFYHLPEHYNTRLCPEDLPNPGENGIFHFVGSPKPWDFGGKWIHLNWRLWRNAIRKTRFSYRRFLIRHADKVLRRSWTLRRSYLRVLINHLKISLKRKRQE